QAQLFAARAQLIVARNDRDRSRLDLRRALNLPLDAPIELSDSLFSLAAPTAAAEQEVIDMALKNRPDVRAIDAQLGVAEQQIAAIRATRLPTVGVFGNDGAKGIGLNHLLNTYNYGVQFTWPLFEGGRREGQIQEQQAATRDIDLRRREQCRGAAPPVKSGKRRIVLPIVLLLAALGAVWAFKHCSYGRAHESTDDAAIDGHFVPVLAKVSGYVQLVTVGDNDHVKADSLL